VNWIKRVWDALFNHKMMLGTSTEINEIDTTKYVEVKMPEPDENGNYNLKDIFEDES